METSFSSLVLGSAPFLVGLFLKFLLDLRIAPWIIKGLNIFPPRSIFRDNPPKIKGEWDVYWESNSENFSNEQDRHKTAKIYQFGNYCFAEYAAKDQRYCLFGKIERSYITGTWYNKYDRYGYRGAFQLKILDSRKLDGRWLGYSNNDNEINTNRYTWTKNPD